MPDATKTLGVALKDVLSDAGDRLRVRVSLTQFGVSLAAEGHGECCAADGDGWPVLLELHGGELRLVVWSNIRSEEPTHVISLAGALEGLR